jgi:hypothetical protein
MTRTTIKNPKSEIRNPKFAAERRGSAIILAVVLTTLLAIVGVLFLFSSRVDSVATSAVGDNETLKLAVDTIVTRISKVLANDVPGVFPDPCLPILFPAYYDYPDPCTDYWLACIEPNSANSSWPHVTDLYNNFGFGADNIAAIIIPEYQPAVVPNTLADADGDGVSDSIWTLVSDVNSSKGKPIFAAIRIIDNGGMININTGFKFDPNSSVGSSQLDINLMAFAQRPFDACSPAEMQDRMDRLVQYRCGTGPNDITSYTNNVVWRYDPNVGPYTPFDISDELELRYRYLINQTSVDTRAETLTKWQIGRQYDFQTPLRYASDLSEWLASSNSNYVLTDPNYAYRHIATTYNMDRIIAPDGNKMFNINNLASNPDVNIVRNAIREAINSNIYDANYIAVNLIDYLDADSNVTYFVDPGTGSHYSGFETPCIYISEIAQNFVKPASPQDANTIRSYAIELFKPYWEDDEPNGWSIDTTDDATGTTKTTPIVWIGSRRFHVLENRNSPATISIDLNEPNDSNFNGDFNSPRQPQHADINFGPGSDIILYRNVNGYGRMIVDLFRVPDATGSWMDQNSPVAVSHSFERDIASIHRCIRRVWSPLVTTPTIGYMNTFVANGTEMIQAHPANKPFTNIGEIGQLFRTDAYGASVGPTSTEAAVRLNIADPCIQNLFEYLTVIDNTVHPKETRIKGRININTAPWFVLAQLPWLSYHTPNYELARSIVAYRDKTIGPGGIDFSMRPGPYGFRNIGELTDVNNMWNDANMGYYIGKGSAIPATLMTPADGVGCVGDVFEERDVIFDRISNLITVRSDVFTAYILVRIGTDGPQKRAIAIFDRSEVKPNPNFPMTSSIPYLGKVKVLAVQNVPDPR